MHKRIISIVQIFPVFEEKIDFLFQTDESFQDLCFEHILCATMALEMKNDPAKNKTEIMEYEELQGDLEEEILQKILEINKKTLTII